MTSVEMRESPLFMRNNFETSGKYGFPIIKNQNVEIDHPQIIACANTRCNDSNTNKNKGVHFFVDDYRFNGIYNNPEKSLVKYSQYAFLLAPDYSTYAEMNPWRQIESIGKSRWCGAYWQSKGLLVIPTISWGTPRSFDFCFDGVELHSFVAIGMVGCKSNHLGFMRGYNAMLEKIEPRGILCLGEPFHEMEGNITVADYDYIGSRKAVR